MPSLLHQPRMVSGTHRLTPREQQLHDLMASGRSDEQCAAEMGIKVQSVRQIRWTINQKLQDLARMGKL